MKLTKLCEKVNIKEIEIKHHLNLLMNSGLVEKEDFGEKKIFYTIKERGLIVLKIFSPIIKNSQKIQLHEFEAITTALLEESYS